MKKRTVKLLLLLCIILILSACNKERMNSSEKEGTSKIQTENTVCWKDVHYSLSRHFEKAVVRDDIVYGYYIDNSGITVAYHNIKDSEIVDEIKIEGVDDIRSITVDSQENIYLLGVKEESEVFLRIDEEGEITSLGEFVLENINYEHEVICKGLFVDEEGLFYFWYETVVPLSEFSEDAEKNVYTLADRIYVKDAQLQTLFYEQIPNSSGCQLLSFSIGNNGVPTILVKDIDGVYVQELRTEQGDVTGKIYINDSGFIDNIENLTAIDGGFLFCQVGDVYKYLFQEQTTEKILDLSSYGIYQSDVIYLGMKEEAIEIVDNYHKSSNSEYTFLEVGQSDELILTMGCMEAFSELENAVTMFNRFSDGVRIEILTYYDEQQGFDAGVEQLKLDIIRGQAPDILEVSMIDYEMLAKKNVFVDLYKYMEQDRECHKEQLISNVLDAYELEGRLYNIAPAFQLYSVWGSSSIIGERYGVTLSEFMQILKDNGENINAIYGFSADEPILTTLCTMGMDEFINWESGSCNFESEHFKDVLVFVKEYEGGYKKGSLSEGIRNGKILMSVGLISNVTDYQLQSKLYGGDVSFIGYPVAEGTGTAVSFRGAQLAINAKGKNQDIAWEFIKFYLTNGYDDEGFPLLKVQFDAKMNEAMEKAYVSTPDGKIPLINRVYKDSNAYIEIYEATQADISAIKKLVGMADVKFKYRTDIQNIINEEAEHFFEEQKGLEEVTALIQNRVSLYLKTQMN